MSKVEQKIYQLYPEIKALLKAKGITLKQIAAEKSISYTILSKLLNEKTYRDREGNELKYHVPHIHRAIAEYLEVSNEELWGPKGKDILAQMITEEAVRALSSKNKRKTFFNSKNRKWNFKQFLRNLINLGMIPTNAKDNKKEPQD